ncbi:lipase lipl-3-like [Daphnia pulicaria]|uniref:lipase lipl-3-like n=1 Tax=Daphnia pulicaria TaxID=35523 RepID=UPI001EEC4BB8|nr:lipase lipl-3-like [Daphnia pulicaria]
MVRLPSLIPFLIFMLCLYLVSQLSQCSTVLNHERQNSDDGRSIFRRKISQSVSQVLSQMWQFSPRAHLSKKQLETDDKFINLTALPSNDERAMNAVQIIINRGYPVASYSVTTSDGYILELHRIPGRKGQTSDLGTGKPVWLQHGLLCSSADWLITPSDQSLAFILADLGYDVWLGNARGNVYSRKHKTLTHTQKSYWDFSSVLNSPYIF